MSRSVSAPSSVTKTSPCWNGFMVPGSTLRYGSSFCMVTRSPRAFSRAPRLEAVSPLPSEEATPPVTKRCLVVVLLRLELPEWGCAKGGLPWLRFHVGGGRTPGTSAGDAGGRVGGGASHQSTGYQP